MSPSAFLERNDPFGRVPRLRTRRAADPRYDGFDSLETQRVAKENLASGASTLYTATTGKRARLRDGLVLLHNPTAAGITADLHHVPSGGSAGSTNKLGPTKTVAVDDTVTFLGNLDLWHVLLSGDALVINTGSAGLNAWLVALEERQIICAFSSGFVGNLGTAEATVYKVPALRSGALANVIAFNPSAGAITLTAWAKAAGAASADSNEILARSIASGAGLELDLGLLSTLLEDGIWSAKGSAAGANLWLNTLLF